MSTVKEDRTELVQDQAEDSSGEDVMRALTFHVMVERGLANSIAMRVIEKREIARRAGR